MSDMLQASQGLPEVMIREDIARWLTAQGYKISPRYLAKISGPAVGMGPPVARWWGQRPLYRPAEALAWAQARCRPHSPQQAA